jgi:hypothetical protein
VSKTIGVRDGDWDFNDYGALVEPTGPDKTSQDLAEVLLSTYNPSRDYGLRIGPGSVPSVGGKAFVSMELAEAVQRLQSLQVSDTASTADERISKVSKLDVTALSDQVSYRFNLAVQTETGATAYASSRVSVRRMSFGQLSQGFSQGKSVP